MSAASRNVFGPLVAAVAALLATLATIAPQGNGPGVTCDEPYHVNQGEELVTALRQQGPAFFLPANIRRNFDWPSDGPPVQVPLGYWILSGTHWLFDPRRTTGQKKHRLRVNKPARVTKYRRRQPGQQPREKGIGA